MTDRIRTPTNHWIIDNLPHIIFFGFLGSLALTMIIVGHLVEIKKDSIAEQCGIKFNPALSLSNYTSYQHCIEYPDTYGVKP